MPPMRRAKQERDHREIHTISHCKVQVKTILSATALLGRKPLLPLPFVKMARPPAERATPLPPYPTSSTAAATIFSTVGSKCISSGGLSGTGTAGKLRRFTGFLKRPKPLSVKMLATSEATLAEG